MRRRRNVIEENFGKYKEREKDKDKWNNRKDREEREGNAADGAGKGRGQRKTAGEDRIDKGAMEDKIVKNLTMEKRRIR